jgi:hypothetical protein
MTDLVAPFAFVHDHWLEITISCVVSPEQETLMVAGSAMLEFRMTAEYPDSGHTTRYCFAGDFLPKSEHLNLKRSDWLWFANIRSPPPS